MEKHTWCSEYIEQKTLADTIEEFMAARGEYDFYFDDRIRCQVYNVTDSASEIRFKHKDRC